MHKQTIWRTVLVAFLIVANSASLVRAEGWSWNPFAKSSSSRSSSPLYSRTSSSSGQSSWLKMPRMPWANSNTPRVNSYSRNNSSTWNRMSKTSKRWWNKTTELLDPYPDPKPSTYSSLGETANSKGNWFTGMFSKKESDAPKTVPDFLRQESPKY